jgi:hypothetical protein
VILFAAFLFARHVPGARRRADRLAPPASMS